MESYVIKIQQRDGKKSVFFLGKNGCLVSQLERAEKYKRQQLPEAEKKVKQIRKVYNMLMVSLDDENFLKKTAGATNTGHSHKPAPKGAKQQE